MGHTSTTFDGKWAYNNVQAEIDFGYRATHTVTVAGKALTEALHREKPSRAYYHGCSTGGRQGLVSAQRFPQDFDGIIAGAPVIHQTGSAMQLLWSVLSLSPGGEPLVTGDDLRRVHDRVLQACDENDGVEDGMIGDPRRCEFDVANVPELSKDKVEAIERVYRGPFDSEGNDLFTGGAQPGSELNWIGTYIQEEGGYGTYAEFQADFFRYMAFPEDPGPSWQPSDFDWNLDPHRLGAMESIYGGSNPDLRKFRESGGKLIVYQGWRDQSVVPLNVIRYMETARAAMGGQDSIDDFARLFLQPGVGHCRGGVGPEAVDWLTHLENWVEKDEPPDSILAMKLKNPLVFSQTLWISKSNSGAGTLTTLQKPDFFGHRIESDLISEEDVVLSRRLYPYPALPMYDGTGSPDRHENWAPTIIEGQGLN